VILLSLYVDVYPHKNIFTLGFSGIYPEKLGKVMLTCAGFSSPAQIEDYLSEMAGNVLAKRYDMFTARRFGEFDYGYTRERFMADFRNPLGDTRCR
jgi:hypothetical protein